MSAGMISPEVLGNLVSANQGAASRGFTQLVQGATTRLEWDLNPGLSNMKARVTPLLPCASGRDNQDLEERLRQGLEKEEKKEETGDGMKWWKKALSSVFEGRGFLLVNPVLPRRFSPLSLAASSLPPRPPHLLGAPVGTPLTGFLLHEGAKNS